jgi:hypothetical protein
VWERLELVQCYIQVVHRVYDLIVYTCLPPRFLNPAFCKISGA